MTSPCAPARAADRRPQGASLGWWIFRAGSTDAGDLALCIGELTGELAHAKGEGPPRPEQAATTAVTAADLRTRSYRAFMARAGSGPIGMISVGRIYQMATGEALGSIQACFVRRGWRGQGVGRGLLYAAMANARAWGLGALEVRCPAEPAFAPTWRFYEHAGFVPVGHTRLRRSL